MNIKKPKMLLKLMTILTLTLGLVYASAAIQPKKEFYTTPYSCMNTAELQIVVERLSNEGNLPFEMGLELMKRWQIERQNIN
ncbi:MAG: Unknown protein [uncultured Sulfurovum sp.]|uniref:Periplasmic protein n=1 Tax=uncultured Sulfurovum sp. TaxID=269237 RepID=A0A6S6T3S0_9BACT|nr:MAG: Unknown protein [uncultured Sulfurovum sp.]